MKLLLVSGACLLFGAAVAAQNYPHAFPRKGVTKLLENERVAAWGSPGEKARDLSVLPP